MLFPTRVSVHELQNFIGKPSSPLIIDVCIDEDFAADPRLVPGAKRWPHMRVSELVPNITPGSNVVVICQKGLKLSMGAAALLRASGIPAASLKGGNFRWRDAGLPLIPARELPSSEYSAQGLWVMDQALDATGLASGWLVRRFLDSRAKFMFVELEHIADVSAKFSAASITGEFSSVLQQFALEMAPLQKLSEMVNTNGIVGTDFTPLAAGFEAALKGVLHLHPDPLEAMEAAIPVLDAFYAAVTNAGFCDVEGVAA